MVRDVLDVATVAVVALPTFARPDARLWTVEFGDGTRNSDACRQADAPGPQRPRIISSRCCPRATWFLFPRKV